MNILIHAANLYSLGARNIGRCIIQNLIRKNRQHHIKVILPDMYLLDQRNIPRNIDIVCYAKNKFPRSIFRLFDVMFGYRNMDDEYSRLLVLGDIPLATNIPQWVLIHQSNLAESCDFHTNIQKKYYSVMRSIFNWNAPKCKGFFVQSDVMKEVLLRRFPMLTGRVHVIPHTIPVERQCIGIVPDIIKKQKSSGRYIFLFPCGGYPHKNHSLVSKMNHWALLHGINNFMIGLTLMNKEVHRIPGLPEALAANGSVLLNLGRLSYPDVMATMEYSDGVFFPSLLESYGLPLVEAMKRGKYVIVSDLPYARWMCESEGIYFDPRSEESAILAIEKAIGRKETYKIPNWEIPLEKIPDDWDYVVDRYMEIMGL